MEATAEIRKEEADGKGRYVQTLEDGSEAYVSFLPGGAGRVIIDYSFVPPAHRGRGLAVPLVRRAVEDARAAGLKITPLCGYVAAVMRRHREWADVM